MQGGEASKAGINPININDIVAYKVKVSLILDYGGERKCNVIKNFKTYLLNDRS